MRIYLIRHGQTTNNVRRILDSNPPGAHLSDLGREQAAGLVGAFDGVHLDAIYVSSLRRTGETAEPLALSRGIDPVELDGLREIEAGSWEGGSDESTYRGYLGTVQQWLSGRLEERMGGGVTGADVLERYDAAIGSIEASGAHCGRRQPRGGYRLLDVHESVGHRQPRRRTGFEPRRGPFAGVEERADVRDRRRPRQRLPGCLMERGPAGREPLSGGARAFSKHVGDMRPLTPRSGNPGGAL